MRPHCKLFRTGEDVGRVPLRGALRSTRGCRRRETSSAPASLHLLAAPDAWRSCAKQSLALLVGCKSPPSKV